MPFRAKKANVFQAMRPFTDDLVRGQYAGYREEANVAKNSDVETFCALRLFIDSWRWDGVPWYLRSGKFLAGDRHGGSCPAKTSATKALCRSAPDPQTCDTNYLRFRLSPVSTIAIAARVKRAEKSLLATSESLPVRRTFGSGIALRTAFT